MEKRIRSTLNENSKKIDKHNFDIIHYSTAKVNNLHLVSSDTDMNDWDSLFNQIKERLKGAIIKKLE